MPRYLLFATTLYALPILRPLEQAIHASGGEAAWFIASSLEDYMWPGEHVLRNLEQVNAFAPVAVFSASNWVPYFFPGFKVQVFHGFNVEKRAAQRGHFRIRGLFDLYCTQGPETTAPFEKLALRHRHFDVIETGWPKLDPLFADDAGRAEDLRPNDGRATCMYAATFTENLSSARTLYTTIAEQVARGDRYWLLTLHPKTEPALVERYRALAGPNARYLEAVDFVPMMRAADVLVSDTSSAVSEFIVQGKPVVTFRNRAPRPHMIDISEPAELEPALQHALDSPAELMHEIGTYAQSIHPYRDGRSSERVLAATAALAAGKAAALAPKPRNLWRKLHGRLRYRRWTIESASD
ncbi:MAG: UDP-N-acetylglucosamine 2-epimerase [Dokdonella sp.]|uniref:UDP-N-acetylglucosamine 2-epimerase n=1 Tax=Dokdonella sp. TaxID=2291710 RepID=UPI002BEA7100|nr:UDP-N-acetylglucosamine 2-epimerase [Dokdonella sp.]HOX71717.1 UDP-N-acetylglucosamine 2-epimerase [Dokdonella sp.]HPN78065.1 UDP-N-acetylglucosamine 2-epimerase [Dokdonella sp.]